MVQMKQENLIIFFELRKYLCLRVEKHTIFHPFYDIVSLNIKTPLNMTFLFFPMLSPTHILFFIHATKIF